MFGYLELTAQQTGTFTFSLTFAILNHETATITAKWKLDLPPGIAESGDHRTMAGQTVVPSGKKVLAESWQITVANNDVYTHAEIKVGAEVVRFDKSAVADDLRTTLAQIVVR